MTQSLIHEVTTWLPFSDSLTIQPDKTYIFSIQIDRNYQAIKEMYPEILSEDELKRSSRFFQKEDRERFISSKFFLRILLSKFLAVPPRQIRYHTMANKKPGISGLSFNVTHSGNYLLIAIGPSAVGIDVERLNRDFDFESVLSPSFSADEIAYIRNDDQVLKFFLLWTRKESLLKASGEGLTDQLDQVSSLYPKARRGQLSYQLKSFKVAEDYVASLAWNQDDQELVYISYDHAAN